MHLLTENNVAPAIMPDCLKHLDNRTTTATTPVKTESQIVIGGTALPIKHCLIKS